MDLLILSYPDAIFEKKIVSYLIPSLIRKQSLENNHVIFLLVQFLSLHFLSVGHFTEVNSGRRDNENIHVKDFDKPRVWCAIIYTKWITICLSVT